MFRFIIFYCFVTSPLIVLASKLVTNDIEEKLAESNSQEDFEEVRIRPEDTPCTCGVFLSSQFKKGSKSQPKGEPVLTQEIDTPFMNNAVGNKQCTHRCLEVIIKHLPKSNEIICATVEKDLVYREKAFLFVKNRSEKWHPTNFSAGREFCCKDHESLKCSDM
ncbi:follicle cell protein 3C [Rhynchophorus ferrugineus]|uniref:Follicle cell protein 3C-1 n=1 Tax=Rhynchophorus ferrugineus TaxID=354439 RepID=A0A834J030_RHYFE|nr:hypothetical protein GWI33_005922 [Rhynchophorus ferrugineus]